MELKKLFLESGYTLTKLPSVIIFRDGKPVAVRAGFANEFQLDDFMEKTLPDVLERTFDEDGIKMIPLPKDMMLMEEKDPVVEESKAGAAVVTVMASSTLKPRAEDCTDPVECYERLEKTAWQNRIVVPAMDGILLPARS